MTNKKITEFTELTAPASTDVLPIIDVSDTSNKKISYANLLSKAPDGSTSAPAFSFNSDPNTGISGGSDTLTFSTGGTGRMSISSAGLVNIVGDLTVGGTTTTINTATLDVEDKNITLGKVSTPTDTTADGGGLTLKGGTDKTFNWVNSTDSWTSSEHLSVSGQKEVRYLDADSSHYVGFKSAATVTSNVVWTLPSADTSVSGYVLSSNASGVLSWVAPGQSASPDFTGTLTLTDDGNIRGFASTQATYTGSVKTFTVTVATKTAAHRYNGSGSSNGYVIDGKEAPFLTLTPGRTYKFDQSHSSNSGHPLRFYLESNKTTSHTTNVTVNGTAGQSGAYVQIVIEDTTPMVLHYQCSSHQLMGNSIQTNSATATGTLLSSLTVTGNLSVSGNILMTGTGAIDVAAGTTAESPGSASAGMIRFNTTTTSYEGYNGSTWGELGGGGISSVVADTSPQLGGQLDTNGNNIKLLDANKILLGTNSSYEIYNDSSNLIIDQNTDGQVTYIRGKQNGTIQFDASDTGNQVAAKFKFSNDSTPVSSVELYHGGVKKAETVTGGFTVTGTCTATAFAGDGSALTGIAAGSTTSVFENPKVLSGNHTINSNNNGLVAGEFSVGSYTLTIPSGCTFVVV